MQDFRTSTTGSGEDVHTAPDGLKGLPSTVASNFGYSPDNHTVDTGRALIPNQRAEEQIAHTANQPASTASIDAPGPVPQSAVKHLATWLRECETTHGAACQPIKHPSGKGTRRTPRFLVDVSRHGQIVRTIEGTNYRYVALSYHRQDENRCNLTIKERHGLLDCQRLSEMQALPMIVRQTIKFVRNLGEQYLWVDFLCLAHGKDDVLHEMACMDKIYAGALFTIIAACENGLYESAPRNASPIPSDNPTPPLDPVRTNDSRVMTGRYEALFGSAWAKRGWTFQERMFSKRALVFVSQASTKPQPRPRRQRQQPVGAIDPSHCFFWECELAMWDNSGLPMSIPMDLAQSRAAIDPKNHMPDGTTDARLHFTRYLEMIYHYNSRRFANPQDVLRAFDGCLRKLSEEFPKSFQDGFECGLPRNMFHESLLWQPLGSVARRECRHDNHLESPHDRLPSWSWCGWECALDTRSLHFDNHEDTTHTEQSKPPAWKMKEPVLWELLHRMNVGLPNSGPRERSEPEDSGDSNWPYLTCLTHTANLFVRHVHPPIALNRRTSSRRALSVKVSATDLSGAPTRRVIALEDGNGHWAGVLGAMSRNGDPTPNDDEVLVGQEVQLMAISEGSVNYEMLEGSYEESTDAAIALRNPDPQRNNPLLNLSYRDGDYEYFNVLWIERGKDCFSRRALGRVEATVWRRLCLGRGQTRVVLD